MQRKNEVTNVFWFFHTPKNKFFSKTLKISAPNSFFPKNDKNLLFIGGLFQQVLLTWNENLCERSKKIEVEDRIQKTDGEDEETVFGLPGAVRSLRIFEEVVVDLVRRICKVGKGAQVENLLFDWFFCASVDVGRFLYLNKYASGLGSTNLCEGFFGLIFPTKRIFEPTVLLLKKAARCQPFLAVVRCLFHNHLRLKRFSLLNVYSGMQQDRVFFYSKFWFSLNIFSSTFRMIEFFLRLCRAMSGGPFRYLEHLHTTAENFSSVTFKKVFGEKVTFSKIFIRIF